MATDIKRLTLALINVPSRNRPLWRDPGRALHVQARAGPGHAYESLLKSRRQILHRRIAEALRENSRPSSSNGGVRHISSYSCGILLSYTLNRSWIIGVGGSRLQALKFGLSTLTGLLISTLLVALLTMTIPAI